MKAPFLFVVMLIACSCGKIMDAGELTEADYGRMARLGLLEAGEKPIKFSSQLTREISGNFYSDRRLASYWIDERDSAQSEVHSAFYSEIIAIDTVPNVGLTYSPFVRVHKSDGTVFSVYFDGDRGQLSEVFLGVHRLWRGIREKK